MTIKLHGFPLSPRAFKVFFAAHQMGVPFEFVTVNFATGDNRSRGGISAEPQGKIFSSRSTPAINQCWP